MQIKLINDDIQFEAPDAVAANDEQLAALVASQFADYATVRITRSLDCVNVTRIPGSKG